MSEFKIEGKLRGAIQKIWNSGFDFTISNLRFFFELVNRFIGFAWQMA